MTPDATADSPGEASKQAPSTAGMTTKVVKGNIWSLAGQVAPLAISLAVTPITIRLLGAESYGIYILIGLIPTYLGFADFGMSIASTKFASEALSAGNAVGEASIVRSAGLIAFLTSLPFALGIFLFSNTIAVLLNIPADRHAEANLALKIASVTFVVSILASVFNTPQLTRLRMDLNTIVSSGFRVIGIVATPVVLYFGGGIIGAVTVLLVASLLTMLGHMYFSGRLLPNLAGFSIDRRIVRPMLKYGSALALANVASVMLKNLEKVALARATSVETLAYYSVAFTLAFTMTLFSVAMAQSLIPAFSQLQGEANRSSLSSLYSRGIWMNVIWLIPVLAILAVFAEPLFSLWAGADFGHESVLPFNFLLIGVGFHVIATPARAAIMTSSRTDVIAKIAWIELVPYIGLVWFLTSEFGAAGAAAAWSIRAVADAVISFTFAKRVSSVTFMGRDLASFVLASLVMVVPLIAVSLDGKNYLLLSAISLVSMIFYVIVVWKLVLSLDEVVWLKRAVSHLCLKTR